jgi:predicted nucleic acid-binding protein
MVATGDEAGVTPDDLPRAFVDSSALMAATLSATGAAYDLLEAGQQGRIALVVSPYVLREVERNLNRKAPRGLNALWERRDQLGSIDPLPSLIDDVARHVEPKDAPIVAAAVAAQADYLVTYDRRHLLSQAEVIRQHYGVEVIEPAVLLARLTTL